MRRPGPADGWPEMRDRVAICHIYSRSRVHVARKDSKGKWVPWMSLPVAALLPICDANFTAARAERIAVKLRIIGGGAEVAWRYEHWKRAVMEKKRELAARDAA